MQRFKENTLDAQNLYYSIYSNGGIFNPLLICELAKAAKTQAELEELSKLLVTFEHINEVLITLFPQVLDYARHSKTLPKNLLTPVDVLSLLKNGVNTDQTTFIVEGYTNVKDVSYKKGYGAVLPNGEALICSIPGLMPVACSDFKISVFTDGVLYTLQFDGVGKTGEVQNPVFYSNELSTINPAYFADSPCVESYP